MDFLKIYSGFISNYNRAIETLNACLKKSSFEKFLMECYQIPEMKRLDLPSLLIMPIQRVPRYQLLLKVIFFFNLNKKKLNFFFEMNRI
jgi:hypothetical protein